MLRRSSFFKLVFSAAAIEYVNLGIPFLRGNSRDALPLCFAAAAMCLSSVRMWKTPDAPSNRPLRQRQGSPPEIGG